ncbi:MAG: recombinase family protein [Anaerorhabdus sp.]
MSKWKIAAYLRLSNDDGDKEESNSITNQKDLISYYINNEIDSSKCNFYVDDGYSGTNFNRPNFQKMIEDIKSGKINTIIVKDLSRFGRNYIETGHYFDNIFPLYNIRFIAINDNIDSYKNPKSMESIIVPVKNLMNDQYAKDVSNKVRSVLNIKREKGEFIGSTAPYGYLKDPNNKYKFIVDKEAALVVKKIFNMVLSGKSKVQIIDNLNKLGIAPPALYKIKKDLYNYKINESMKIWTRGKLDAILKNKAYTGILIQNKRKKVSYRSSKILHVSEDEWISIENNHKAIINLKDFNKVQNMLHNNDIRIRKNKNYDVFSGYLKCSDCGSNLTIIKSKNKEYYYCSSFLRKKMCSKHNINRHNLIDIVLTIINKHIKLIIDIDKQINELYKVNSDIDYDLELAKNKIAEIEAIIYKKKTIKRITDG